MGDKEKTVTHCPNINLVVRISKQKLSLQLFLPKINDFQKSTIIKHKDIILKE